MSLTVRVARATDYDEIDRLTYKGYITALKHIKTQDGASPAGRAASKTATLKTSVATGPGKPLGEGGLTRSDSYICTVKGSAGMRANDGLTFVCVQHIQRQGFFKSFLSRANRGSDQNLFLSGNSQIQAGIRELAGRRRESAPVAAQSPERIETVDPGGKVLSSSTGSLTRGYRHSVHELFARTHKRSQESSTEVVDERSRVSGFGLNRRSSQCRIPQLPIHGADVSPTSSDDSQSTQASYNTSAPFQTPLPTMPQPAVQRRRNPLKPWKHRDYVPSSPDLARMHDRSLVMIAAEVTPEEMEFYRSAVTLRKEKVRDFDIGRDLLTRVKRQDGGGNPYSVGGSLHDSAVSYPADYNSGDGRSRYQKPRDIALEGSISPAGYIVSRPSPVQDASAVFDDLHLRKKTAKDASPPNSSLDSAEALTDLSEEMPEFNLTRLPNEADANGHRTSPENSSTSFIPPSLSVTSLLSRFRRGSHEERVETLPECGIENCETEKIIGCVTYAPYESGWGLVSEVNEVELRMLSVAPIRAVAGALIDHCIIVGHQERRSAIHVLVHEQNRAAHLLYHRHGFVRNPEKDRFDAKADTMLKCFTLDLHHPKPLAPTAPSPTIAALVNDDGDYSSSSSSSDQEDVDLLKITSACSPEDQYTANMQLEKIPVKKCRKKLPLAYHNLLESGQFQSFRERPTVCVNTGNIGRT